MTEQKVNNILSMYNEALIQLPHNTKEDVEEYIKRYCDAYNYPSEVCEHCLALLNKYCNA